MKKKDLKNLTLTKKTISKITTEMLQGGAIDTLRASKPYRPVPISARYSNCASYCYACQ
ncbi:hypothetical protein [uncultured Kordia sp.]|uniref:hypothetical protein n=1 Tax=uncultured Kordia sp. TaxID=507699 RepID=UPI002613E0BA|nr:hypothetical protein [uncultured Kordia sp.]